MSRFVPSSVGVLALAILIPAVGQSQNTKPASDDAAMKAKYLAGSYVAGKLTKVDVDGDTKKLTVQVSWQAKVLDDAAKKKYDDLNTKYQAAVKARNTGQMKTLGTELQKTQATLYKNETQTLDLDFVGEKGTVVRKSFPPPKDAATFKDLETDQNVKVTLDRGRGSKMKKEDLEAGYPINFILILPKTEAAAGSAALPKPKN